MCKHASPGSPTSVNECVLARMIIERDDVSTVFPAIMFVDFMDDRTRRWRHFESGERWTKEPVFISQRQLMLYSREIKRARNLLEWKSQLDHSCRILMDPIHWVDINFLPTNWVHPSQSQDSTHRQSLTGLGRWNIPSKINVRGVQLLPMGFRVDSESSEHTILCTSKVLCFHFLNTAQ